MSKADTAIIKSVAKEYSYGWGVIYVTVTIDKTTWTTAVIPKDGQYLIPLKAAIREAVGIELGDEVSLNVKLGKQLQSQNFEKRDEKVDTSANLWEIQFQNG